MPYRSHASLGNSTPEEFAEITRQNRKSPLLAGAVNGRGSGLHLADYGLAWVAYGLSAGHRRGELYALRRFMFANSFPICNRVWAMSYQEAIGYRFGVRAAWTTPDTMRDHVLLHSQGKAILTPEDLPAKQKGG